MFWPTVIMGVMAFVLFVIAYRQGGGMHIVGMHSALKMMLTLLPLLLFAMFIASMVQLLIPPEGLSKWVGTESGMRGIILGSLAGGLSPGGPMVSLPMAAGFVGAGAGIGTVVAYLTGWSLWGITRIPMEVGILGWRITLIRLACTFFVPVLAGVIAHIFFSGAK